MKQFKSDVMRWKDYDFTVINDEIEKCYKKIISFINNHRLKRSKLRYDKSSIRKHIKELIN